MLVMFDVTDPVRGHTMIKGEGKAEIIDLKGLLVRDDDYFVRAAIEAALLTLLEVNDRGDRRREGGARCSCRTPVGITSGRR